MSGRKRLEALNEILESEKSFVNDIANWTRKFRMRVMRSPTIDSREKFSFCDKVFMNSDEILVLHEKILRDLEYRTCVEARGVDACTENHGKGDEYGEEERVKSGIQDLINREEYTSLEYHTIFSRYVREFAIYKKYVTNLPYAESLLTREISSNEGFKAMLHAFLREINSESLNYTHFMYRPTQKLTRYCMLFQSVIKNETNEEYKEHMEELLMRVDSFTKEIDKIYGQSKNFFRIYEISKCLRNGKFQRENISLNLFSKKRRLIKEGDVIMRTRSIVVPKVMRVIVFNHLILVCDVFSQNTVELLYLQEVFAPHKLNMVTSQVCTVEEGYTKELFPLYLVSESCNSLLGMFFRNKQERDVWANVMNKAIENCTKHYKKGIEIVDLEHITNEDLQYVCEAFKPFDASGLPDDNFSFFVGTDSEEKEELGEDDRPPGHSPKESHPKEMLTRNVSEGPRNMENIRVQVGEDRKKGFLQRLLFGGDMFGKKLWMQRIPSDPENRNFVLFTTKKGVYRRHRGVNVLVYPRPAKKVVFNAEMSLLVLQEEDKVLVSPFGAETTSLALKILHVNSESFFYCESKTCKFIIVKKGGAETFSMVYMYMVEEVKGFIRISMFRRLYIGSNVQNVKFFGNEIIVAARFFELINPDTLVTTEVINPLDTYLPYYFFMCKDARARSILRVSKDHYLVCFDVLGFIIDYYGRSAKSHIVFSWNCEPHDFKVFRYYLVVLGRGATSVFSLKTGALLFFNASNTYHFCAGSNPLLMYDKHRFYKLVLPGISTAVEAEGRWGSSPGPEGAPSQGIEAPSMR